MSYFKWVGLLAGFLALLSAGMVFIAPGRWTSWVLGKIYPAKRPLGLIPAAVLWFGLIIYSWHRFLLQPGGAALMITLFLTFSGVKLFLMLQNYDRLRALVVALLTREKTALRVISACSLAVGIGLIVFALKV